MAFEVSRGAAELLIAMQVPVWIGRARPTTGGDRFCIATSASAADTWARDISRAALS